MRYGVISRKRREHLSEEDILRNKAIMESLSKGGHLIEQNFEPTRRQSLTPPLSSSISWEEYITADNGRAPHLGRELVCKESKKNFKATIAMSQDFPLGIESKIIIFRAVQVNLLGIRTINQLPSCWWQHYAKFPKLLLMGGTMKEENYL
uniref:Uncharacterized protein n=1 Tax=Fundulus heteroclitus TaxID=8078 RepID=A0A3Q2PCD0_FUNHE